MRIERSPEERLAAPPHIAESGNYEYGSHLLLKIAFAC
jgi:hypothetical protein